MRSALLTGTETHSVHIPLRDVTLEGDLTLPNGATGAVIFAHGSGSGRHSPRNQMVARHLQDAGIGTLLFDLLTRGEAAEDAGTAHLRFDIGFLADRLAGTADWLADRVGGSGLKLGYFGASTGAAAALVATARRPHMVSAIVSRGGRPDLAGPALGQVMIPTLLIVGARDPEVIRLNQMAFARLASRDKELIIVPGATHLFEEPGTLEEVAHLASLWFSRHFPPPKGRAPRAGTL